MQHSFLQANMYNFLRSVAECGLIHYAVPNLCCCNRASDEPHLAPIIEPGCPCNLHLLVLQDVAEAQIIEAQPNQGGEQPQVG